MLFGEKRWIGFKVPHRAESPSFRFSKTNFSASEVWSQNLESGAYTKYSPFNYFMVTNNTNKTLVLLLNGETFKTFPTGVVESIDEQTLPAFRNFSLKTSDAGAATGTVEIIIQKTISQRQILRELIKSG